MEIYLTDASGLPDPRADERLLAALPSWRKERALRPLSAEKRKEALGAGLLLEQVFRAHGWSAEEIFTDPGGKPLHPGTAFSLSHSGGKVALALGNGRIGCDLERLRAVPERVAALFSARERAFLEEETERGDRTRAFFRLWTMRESYLKLTGEGLSALKSVEADARSQTIYRAGSKENCRVRTFFAQDCCLSVCTDGDERGELQLVRIG